MSDAGLDGSAELQVWPDSCRIARNRTGQYTQLVLHDSELEVCCHSLGVLLRKGAVMLALPDAFMDVGC